MNLEIAKRLLAEIPPEAKVLDVGGGASPFPRADWVIDALPFESLGGGSHGNIHKQLSEPPRYSRDRWVQMDLCAHERWPFEDKSFDFVNCSHLLEDVRDPIWITSEIRRVGKAGYIEVPSRVEEQSKGVENPRHAGYYHHRWLINRNGNGLDFRHKPHVLHSVNDAIVTHLNPYQQIQSKHAIVSLHWTEDFMAREVLEFNEGAVIDELCAFAREARLIPDLKVNLPATGIAKMKRRIFFFRLAMGWR